MALRLPAKKKRRQWHKIETTNAALNTWTLLLHLALFSKSWTSRWPAAVAFTTKLWVGCYLLNSGWMTPKGRASMSSVHILLSFFHWKDPPLQVSAFQFIQPSPCLGVRVVHEECSKAHAIGISARQRLNSRTIALPSWIEGDKTVVGESPCHSAASLGTILVMHHLTK